MTSEWLCGQAKVPETYVSRTPGSGHYSKTFLDRFVRLVVLGRKRNFLARDCASFNWHLHLGRSSPPWPLPSGFTFSKGTLPYLPANPLVIYAAGLVLWILLGK